MSRVSWPLVVLVAVCLAAITAILLYGKAGDVQARAVEGLVSTVGPLLASLYVAKRVETKVGDRADELKEQVNGRMSELIAKVPDQVAPHDGTTDYDGRHNAGETGEGQPLTG